MGMRIPEGWCSGRLADGYVLGGAISAAHVDAGVGLSRMAGRWSSGALGWRPGPSSFVWLTCFLHASTSSILHPTHPHIPLHIHAESTHPHHAPAPLPARPSPPVPPPLPRPPPSSSPPPSLGDVERLGALCQWPSVAISRHERTPYPEQDTVHRRNKKLKPQ